MKNVNINVDVNEIDEDEIRHLAYELVEKFKYTCGLQARSAVVDIENRNGQIIGSMTMTKGK